MTRQQNAQEPQPGRPGGALALALVLLLGLVAAAVHPLTFSVPELKQNVFLLGCAALLVLPGTRPVLRRPLSGPALWLALLPLAAALSAFLSRGNAVLCARSWAVLVGLVLVTLAVREVFWVQAPRLLLVLLLLGGTLGAIALLQVVGVDLIYPAEIVARLQLPEGHPVATFGNTNILAAVLAPLSALSVALCYRRGGTGLLATLLLPLTSAAVVVSHSRAGWLALTAGVLVVVWKLRLQPGPQHGRVAAALGAGLCIGLLAPASESEAGQTGLDFGFDRASNTIRWEIAERSVRLFQEDPILGHGPGQFRVEFPRHRSALEAGFKTRAGAASEVDHPHNTLLQVLTEEGLVGALLLAAAVLALWVQALRGDQAHRHDDGSGQAAIAGGLTAALVISWFWSALQPEVGLITAVLLGAALSGRVEYASAATTQPWLERPTKGLLALVFALLAGPGLIGEWWTVSAVAADPLRGEELERLAEAAAVDRFSIDRQQVVGSILLSAARQHPDAEHRWREPAGRSLRRGLSLHPRHAGMLWNYAEVLIRDGLDRWGLAYLRRSHRLEPWRQDPVQRLNELQREEGRSYTAAQTAAAAVEPDQLREALEEVEALRSGGDARGAAQRLDALALRFPDQAELHRAFAAVWKELGDDNGYRLHKGYEKLAWVIESLRLGEVDVARRNLVHAGRYLGKDHAGVGLLDCLVRVREGDLEGAAAALASTPAQPDAAPAWVREALSGLTAEPVLRPLLPPRGIPPVP